MILRMENGSQWREVVWALKSLQESGRKVVGKHHNRAGRGLLLWVERRRREEERESALNFYLVQKKLRQINTWLKLTLKSNHG